MLSEDIKERIRKWAAREPLVLSAYIFGSRARSDYSDDSDLDVAIEIDQKKGDASLIATWTFEGDKLQKRLAKKIPEFKVDLQWFNGEERPIILKGINESSLSYIQIE